MSKAEEKSKQYRDFREQCGIKDSVMLGEIEEAYFEGYSQAKEDSELTWEDMELIYEISCDVFYKQDGHFYNMSKIWEEVLKLFKERKEK